MRTIAKDVTSTLSAGEFGAGRITSLSAAPVTLTLPSLPLAMTLLGAAKGDIYNFIVDNTLGANIVTVAVSAGITVITAVVTGSDNLAVGVGSIGYFKLYFNTSTTAKLIRDF